VVFGVGGWCGKVLLLNGDVVLYCFVVIGCIGMCVFMLY